MSIETLPKERGDGNCKLIVIRSLRRKKSWAMITQRLSFRS
nr:MAG TPA: hypothetical protein [Caudoviricetes sp.]